jgi:hypothetical protein
LGNLFENLVDGISPRVIVPDRPAPSLGALRCTYHPTVRGQRDQSFVANRS